MTVYIDTAIARSYNPIHPGYMTVGDFKNTEYAGQVGYVIGLYDGVLASPLLLGGMEKTNNLSKCLKNYTKSEFADKMIIKLYRSDYYKHDEVMQRLVLVMTSFCESKE